MHYGDTFEVDFEPFVADVMRMDHRCDAMFQSSDDMEALRAWAREVMATAFEHLPDAYKRSSRVEGNFVVYPRTEVHVREVVHDLNVAMAASCSLPPYDMGINPSPFAWVHLVKNGRRVESLCTSDGWRTRQRVRAAPEGATIDKLRKRNALLVGRVATFKKAAGTILRAIAGRKPMI